MEEKYYLVETVSTHRIKYITKSPNLNIVNAERLLTEESEVLIEVDQVFSGEKVVHVEELTSEQVAELQLVDLFTGEDDASKIE